MRYTWTDTIVTFGLDKQETSLVRDVCDTLNVSCFRGTTLTDLIAVPCFLVIMNPSEVSKENLEELYAWVEEMGDKDYVVFFSRLPTPPPPRKLERHFTVTDSLPDKQTIKLTILQRRSAVSRRKKELRKYDRRIFRLMFILRELRKTKIVCTKGLAREFNVTSRTVQRDIELLQSLGELVEYDTEKQGYVYYGDNQDSLSEY